MAWTLKQCQDQADGIAWLEKLRPDPKLRTKQEKIALIAAKGYFSDHKCGKRLKSASKAEMAAAPSIPASTIALSNGVSPSSSNPPIKPMGLGDIISTAVTAITGSGRANTTAPTAEEPTLVGSLLGIAGNVLSAVIPGGPATAVALGTLGETKLPSTGRAYSDMPLEAEPGMTATQTMTAYGYGTPGLRLPSTSKVRRLVRLVGVTSAAAMLGLSVQVCAMIATRPYRRRGISAASLRITRRTIRAVNSIQHSLSKIKKHR